MLFKTLRRLLGGRKHARRPYCRRPNRSNRISLEQLEDRFAPAALVYTDKLDYAPGQMAVITATGFGVGEAVTFQVVHDPSTPGIDGGSGHDPWTVRDGGRGDLDGMKNGMIRTVWYVHPDDSEGANFILTAVGLRSGLTAQATFADAPPPFDVDFVAAEPTSYDHLTGGGTFDERDIGEDVVESLEGGDFNCDDIVSFLAQIEVTGGGDGQTGTFTFSFASDSTGQSGVGYIEVVGVTINDGTDGPVTDNDDNIDSGFANYDGAEIDNVNITNPPQFFVPGAEIGLSFDITDLDEDEIVIVRIDVRIGCDVNSDQATGNVQATLESPGGAQTIPLMNPGAVAPPQIDLSVLKEVDDATPNVGDDITFTITVSNAGPDEATGVAVGDLLPAGLTFVSDTPSQGSYDDVTGIWTVGTLASGASATLDITATVTGSVAFDNCAEVTAADQADVDSTPDPTPDQDEPTEDDEFCVTVTPNVADLSLTKIVNDSTPNVGDDITFTITLTNDGPADATGVAVGDLLPAGLDFVSSNPSQGTYDEITGIWDVGTVANGASATLEITATVTDPDLVTNCAEVTASDVFDPDSDPDPTPDNDEPSQDDEACVDVTPQQADLSLTKIVSDSTPNVGDDITFTITVTNDGPDDATNVEVGDLLPAGLDFVSDNPSQGSYDENTGIWTVGDLADGASATLEITATVTSAGIKTNCAEVTASDQFDPDSTPDATPDNDEPSEDDEACVDVTPQEADLSLDKIVSNEAPNVGDQVTFTITVTNSGPDDATNVVIGDVLPAGVTFVSDNPSVGTYDEATGLWDVGTVAAGTSETLEITVIVIDPEAITNCAEVVASDQFDPDSTPDPTPDQDEPTEDDEACVSLDAPEADLSLTKLVSDSTPNVGDDITFTITVTNDGPDTATGVAVGDILPAGLDFVSDNPSQGSYDENTGIWTVGTLNNGESATLEITVTVTSADVITNCAEVTASDQIDPDSTPDATPDNSEPNEDDEACVDVTPNQADLSLTKIVSDSTPNVGDDITFTITVTNDGPNDATGVEIGDVLPAGVTFVSDNPSQGSYDENTGIWDVGTVANGASATLEITVTVVSPDLITNCAEITASDVFDPDSTPDPTPDNDEPTEDDEACADVTPLVADLSLTKTVDNAAPNIDEDVTFTITVTNDGPDTATNVTVTDVLPAGLDFVSDTPSQGSYDENTGIWTIGTLTSGQSVTLQITATVTTIGTKTNYAQVETSDQFDPDSTPGNDSTDEDDDDTASVTPKLADLMLTKTVDNTTPTLGSNVVFTLELTNNGPDTATNVTVQDILPTGVTFVSSTATQGSYSAVTDIWTVGTVPVGAHLFLDITVTVTSLGPITNFAQVETSDQPDPDSQPGDDSMNEDDDDPEEIIVIPPPPSSLSGFVYLDKDNDGIKDADEAGIAGTLIILTGTNALGDPVNIQTLTNASGFYNFTGLLPGTYSIREIQPANFIDGIDTIGSLGGSTSNDFFFNIDVEGGESGINYNFGERVNKTFFFTR